MIDRRQGIVIFGFAFLVYAGISIPLSSIPYDKVWAGVHLGTLALAFAVGVILRRARCVWVTLTALTCVNVVIAFVDWDFGWNSGFEGYQGYMGNPNIFGCFLVLALAATISYRILWSWPFLPVGLWLSSSRTAALGTGVVLFIWLWRSYRVTAIVALCVTIAVIGELTLHGQQREIGIAARLGVWQDTLNHLTLAGSGFGSFFEAYNLWPIHTNMTFVRPTHAYNDFLELVFELGLGAIFLWTFLALIFDRGINLFCWAFLALSLTYFPLTLPILGHLFAFAIGSLYKEQSYGTMAFDDPALSRGSWGRMGASAD